MVGRKKKTWRLERAHARWLARKQKNAWRFPALVLIVVVVVVVVAVKPVRKHW